MRTDLPDADTCERIFHAALSEGDTEGVEAALRLLIVQDPRRATALWDELKTALAIRRMVFHD